MGIVIIIIGFCHCDKMPKQIMEEKILFWLMVSDG